MSGRVGLLLVAAVVLVSACGSGDGSTGASDVSETTVAVAGAQENAVVSGAVCYSWPDGTTDAQPCAVGLKGPGGGRVFYDAGSAQPWGRFLEVAPQAWGGTLVECKTCGAATEAPYFVTKQTSDGGSYTSCSLKPEATWVFDAAQGQTGEVIGDGRRNTSLIGGKPECVSGEVTAFVLASSYKGVGQSDWYLPSLEELLTLCRYDGRNAIGGFPNDKYYISSSANMFLEKPASFKTVVFTDGRCDVKLIDRSGLVNSQITKGYVRPIRAFS